MKNTARVLIGGGSNGKTMRNCLAVVRLLFLRLRVFCILNLYKIFDTKKGALLWVKCLQQRRE